MNEVEEFEKNNLTSKLIENHLFRSMEVGKHEMFKFVEDKFDVVIEYEIDE